MRPSAVLLPALLLPVLGAAPALALVAPSPSPSPAEDPCAPVDGQVPLMCQSGMPAGLPLTGVPAGAAAAGLVVVGAALVVRRRVSA